MNITQSREDAEDAMQDAFLKSYQHLDNFQGDSRFYTWLVRIAVNEALMRLRRRRPNVTSLDEPIQSGDDALPPEIKDWGPTPEQRYSQRRAKLHPEQRRQRARTRVPPLFLLGYRAACDGRDGEDARISSCGKIPIAARR